MCNSGKVYTTVKSNALARLFYSTIGEDDCKVPESSRKGRVDPVLKLYGGCALMLTRNSDVGNGQANGSRLTLHKIMVKRGERHWPLRLKSGVTVNALYASQVRHIVVKHVAADVQPMFFTVETQVYPFSCKLEVEQGIEVSAKMKGIQFPLISNLCTTGHKLQGCGVNDLLVDEWFYGQNWPYVVLSRVKQMKGLFVRVPLSEDLSKYKMSEKMKSMLLYFRGKCAVEMFSEEQYKRMERSVFTDKAVPDLQ
jgi:hypothetical protein